MIGVFGSFRGNGMKRFILLFIGWAAVLGSFLDLGFGGLAVWFIATGGWTQPWMSVDVLLEHHLSGIRWLKQVPYFFMPGELVTWVFAQPALVFFTVRFGGGLLIGWWALAAAGRANN